MHGGSRSGPQCKLEAASLVKVLVGMERPAEIRSVGCLCCRAEPFLGPQS